MRIWILGGFLTAVTVTALSFIAAGAGNPTHCGPCLTSREKQSLAAAPVVCEPVEGEAVMKPPVPPLPFVSYEEPPLANPRIPPAGEIIPATYVEPVSTPQPQATVGVFPLATGNDPY